MAQDTDYNPAIRKEVKADADTGRTFKKWKHRAQGAGAGAAVTAGAIVARKPLARAGKAIARLAGKKFSTVPHGTINMSAIFGIQSTELSFDSAAEKISKKEDLPEDRAKAILASSSRHASQKAVRKNPALLRVPRGHHKMSEIFGITTDFSLHGGFKDMLESSVKLKKTHMKAWKEMTPKEREVNRADLRAHRDAINEQERASDSTYGFSFMSSMLRPTSFSQGEKHPGDLPLDPATLRRNKLNAGQTGPEEPLMPQAPLVRIKSKNTHMSDRRSFTNFATDTNGRPHSSAGTFEPEVDGVSSQSIQRAYSPKNRLTGRSPLGDTIRRQVAKRALARCGRSTDLDDNDNAPSFGSDIKKGAGLAAGAGLAYAGYKERKPLVGE